MNRNPQINIFCPPHRAHDDKLYAQWVINVAGTMKNDSTIEADRLSYERWQSEAAAAATFLNA